MSTHATPESRAESSAEPTVDPDPNFDRASDRDAGSRGESAADPFETHNAAATFGASDRRLPNTIDSENRYLG